MMKRGILGKLRSWMNGEADSAAGSDIFLWGTAISAVAIAVIISTTVIKRIERHSYLEEKARLLRMCRENPKFNPQKCAELLKTLAKSTTPGTREGKGTGHAAFVGDGREKQRLSDITWNHALLIDEE